MPYLVGNSDNSLTQALTKIGSKEYDYDYPGGLDLRPTSELHKRIVTEVIARARESHEVMSIRYTSWKKQDQVLTTYKYVDEAEEKVQEKDSRKPVSIVFPYTYAVMETLITYLSTAFFQDPIFTYEGVSPDDEVGAKLLTLLVRMHCERSKVPLALHTMFRDCLAYGIGPVSPSWTVRYGSKVREVMGSAYDVNGVQVAGASVKESYRSRVFEGNTLDNIDPYKYLPDPNIAAHKVQENEYTGWWYRTDRMALLNDEQSDPDMFNVKYLKHLDSKLSFLAPEQSDRNKKEQRADVSTSKLTSKVDIIPMYINLVPSDWGLGDSDYPEKWWFEVAADSIVIRAKKMEQNHGLYPIAVACPDFDGYTSTPLSRLESLYGLQHTMDWLFNSHIANVRKAMNDMLVLDPWMVNINDVKDPKPGKLIRLRRPAWGKGRVSDYIAQLAVTDVTRTNIADSEYIASWMQKMAATDDPMMGTLRSGGPERLTAEEFSGTRGSGLGRLERLARTVSYQAMHDIGFFFASHAQQYIEEETWARVVGDLPALLAQEFGGPNASRVRIKPSDLYIEYDVITRDGSIPGSSDSKAWLQLFNIVSMDPVLRQMFDVPRIFTHIARELGAKNVDQFKTNINQIQTQVMSDEKVEKEVDKGNMIPVEG